MVAHASLDRRARNGTVGTKHAAIARLWLEPFAATLAVIEEPTGIRGHLLGRLVTTARTGNSGFEDQWGQTFPSPPTMPQSGPFDHGRKFQTDTLPAWRAEADALDWIAN